MLCVKCKKNLAVVFVKKVEGSKTETLGYCLSCARELGNKDLDDAIKAMGINPEEMGAFEDQLKDMYEMAMSGDMDIEGLNESGIMNLFNLSDFPGSFGGEHVEEDKDVNNTKTQTKEKKNSKKKKMLDSFGVNLNKKAKDGEIDRVIGREKEILRVAQILNRRAKNNPCLIGEPGVGKTAIAEGLALKIVEGDAPSKLLNKQIYLLDFTAIVAGTQFRGQFEARIKKIIDEVKADGNIILAIDEIHNITGAGASEGALSAANILKPALTKGEIQIIGATTLDEYRKYIEKDKALERRLQSVMVNEATVEETIEIIKGIRDYYQEFHKVILSDAVIEKAASLSKRYISGRFLPDKAIDVIDEAGSLINLNNKELNRLTVLKNELQKVQQQKESAVSADSIEEYQKTKNSACNSSAFA